MVENAPNYTKNCEVYGNEKDKNTLMDNPIDLIPDQSPRIFNWVRDKVNYIIDRFSNTPS